MNILQKQLNDCNNCPFEDYDINWYDEKKGYGKLAAHSYENSDNSVMVIGQNPSHRRSQGNYCMCGHQGDPFREIFSKEKLVFTNFIQVSTPDNKVDKLTDDQLLHCINHLIVEIKYFKPQIIIVCSAFAKKKLKMLDKKLDVTGAKVFFINHPDYYMTYRRGDINEYYDEIKNIKRELYTLPII